jgi:phosphoenolpyruvate-protein phosphotransferase (PTS system enzyme I)
MSNSCPQPRNIEIRGIAVSSGIAEGKVLIIDRCSIDLPRRMIANEEVEREVARLVKGINDAELELIEVKNQISENLSTNHVLIIDAHILILKDEMLQDHIFGQIRDGKRNAEWALETTIDYFNRQVFDKLADEYIRERQTDLSFVGERVMRQLVGKSCVSIAEVSLELEKQEHSDGVKPIVFAGDLSPADTAQMKLEFFAGFVTEIGGRTSHTAIIARALGMPAVVGTGDLFSQVKNGDTAIVDGGEGLVIIDPDEETLKHYRAKREQYNQVKTELLQYKDIEGRTADGRRIKIESNIELFEEVDLALHYGCEGIGLFRTEYLYMNRNSFPDEEEIYTNFKNAAEKIAPHPMVIRVLDIGGDKFLSSVPMHKEMNSALGLRAIRFLLKEVEIFKSQLRAILRASVHGDVRIMLPLISGLAEVREAKQIVEEVKEDLLREGIPFNDKVPIGIMIETPSACMIADHLARETDFFSIGTNDLIQYTLAIDRTNEHVAHLYQPLHPSILRLVGVTVEAARHNNIPISMCGEMASDPFNLLFLVGIGLTSLSMDPPTIPLVKKMLRKIESKKARKIAKKAMRLSTASEVSDFLIDKTNEIFDLPSSL